MSRGIVFDIQRYAVHDGPGIRTLVFLKGCPLRCAWCCNPESQESAPQLMRRLPDEEPCLVGREYEAQALVAEVARDRDFYRNSGGGVTFSGGEPFFQPDFLGDLLEGGRREGISTAVETCGYGAKEIFLRLEPLIDLFLFDLKVLDPQQHRSLTGKDNDLILENFRALARQCPDKMQPRLTVVPGVSDGAEDLAALALLLKEAGVPRLELLAYHPLGLGKWKSLAREPAYQPDPCSPVEKSLAAARNCLAAAEPSLTLIDN